MNNNTKIEVAREIMNFMIGRYGRNGYDRNNKALMQVLADETKRMHYKPEQVQDFTPTPMTLSTTMFYTGINPYTREPIYVARTPEEKKQQNQYFFWYKPEKSYRSKDKNRKR